MRRSTIVRRYSTALREYRHKKYFCTAGWRPCRISPLPAPPSMLKTTERRWGRFEKSYFQSRRRAAAEDCARALPSVKNHGQGPNGRPPTEAFLRPSAFNHGEATVGKFEMKNSWSTLNSFRVASSSFPERPQKSYRKRKKDGKVGLRYGSKKSFQMLAWRLRSNRVLQQRPALLISTHGDMRQ